MPPDVYNKLYSIISALEREYGADRNVDESGNHNHFTPAFIKK